MSGAGSIACTIIGNTDVPVKVIKWSRAANGTLTCSSSADFKFEPKECN
ncbi:pilin [Massilia violaceinigra]